MRIVVSVLRPEGLIGATLAKGEGVIEYSQRE